MVDTSTSLPLKTNTVATSHLAAFDTVKGKNNVNMFASELYLELVTLRGHTFHQSYQITLIDAFLPVSKEL